MNYQELQEAKATFQYARYLNEDKEVERLRKQFIKRFTRTTIESMRLDDFVQGKGNHNTFCYGVEWELDRLGRIVGSTCIKFGIYWSEEDNDYRFAKKFGKSPKEAFKNIKAAILDLLDAGNNIDEKAIVKNPLSPMFKGKILSIYYPDRYLNIFSDEHLDYYLKALDLDAKGLKDAYEKRKALVEFKNKDKDLKKWSLRMFSAFLVFQYPKEPKSKKDKENTPPSDCDFNFPTTDKYQFIDLNLVPNTTSSIKGKSTPKGKADYAKEERRKTKLGDRGEKIVMMAEIERVMEANKVDRVEAEKMVIRKSLESDAIGYDIQSVNPDGSPRYIEVKATTGKKGDMSFFYTINEYETAKKLKKNYFIYIVYEILTSEPKIWIMENPFLKKVLTLEPIKFKVNVKTK